MTDPDRLIGERPEGPADGGMMPDQKSRSAPLETCPGCGVLCPPADGPTHRYIGASAGCWALFAPLSAGESPDPDLLAGSRIPELLPHQPSGSPLASAGALLVDAYAVQHHGDASAQAVQSVAVHLLTLHGVLRCGVDTGRALWLRRRALRTRDVFHQLEPPRAPALTIRHLFPGGGVVRPRTAADYVMSVYAVWDAQHHDTLSTWYERYVLAE